MEARAIGFRPGFEGEWRTVRVTELMNYADALERFISSGYIDR
jgi:hypothetical protein